MRMYTPPTSERRKVVVSLLDRGDEGRQMLAMSFVQPAQKMYKVHGEQGVYDSLQKYATLVPIERRDELLEALRLVEVFKPGDGEQRLHFPWRGTDTLEIFEPNWDQIEAILRTAPEAELDYDLRLTEAEITELSTGAIPDTVEQKALAVLTEIASDGESLVH